MATLQDIYTSAYINLVSVFVFLVGFTFLRLQPVNNAVYFAKWFKEGKSVGPTGLGTSLMKFVNLDLKTYLTFWSWISEALKMTESELIDYAGLDSVAYIRIYLLGLKIFVPVAILALLILVPVNLNGETLQTISDLTYSDIDKLSLSNVPSGSLKLSAHTIMAYVVTFWTCFVLHQEYKFIANKRLLFIASEKRRPYQFTVLVRNIPDINESVSEDVEHFFCVNHPEHYLTHQVVLNAIKLARMVQKKKRFRSLLTHYETLFEQNPEKRPRIKTGLWGLLSGDDVDAVNYYKAVLERKNHEEDVEREKIMKNRDSIVPAAFVSFKSRWGAAVCAQTQQSYNPTQWLTEQAPELRDVYWENLSIPYVRFSANRVIIVVSMFFLTFFFMIPIAFVQSMASIDGMQTVLVFLRPLFRKKRIKAIVQGYLPGFTLRLFTAAVPTVVMMMSKMEGHISRLTLDRKTAGKYHFFILVNVFFGSIITGAAFQQLKKFLHHPASEIPKTLGVAMPIKATFFITYIMMDGWSGVASEIFRFVPLLKSHVRNTFLVTTEWDKEVATRPTSLDLATTEPQTQLYFLLGLVYSVVSPLILPFIIVFFGFSYLIYRYQIINVYDQKYESGASFWPDVHCRIIVGLVISQILLMGLLSTKDALVSTPLLLILTAWTIWFHQYCKARFEPVFVNYPLEEATMKDEAERSKEPELDLRAYLHEAYVHPAMRHVENDQPKGVGDWDKYPVVKEKKEKEKEEKEKEKEKENEKEKEEEEDEENDSGKSTPPSSPNSAKSTPPSTPNSGIAGFVGDFADGLCW